MGYQLAKLLLFQGHWKVTGIARGQRDYVKDIQGYNIIECDLLGSDEDVRKTLEPHVKDVTHLFFMMWIQKSTEEEQVKVNSKLFNTVINPVVETSTCLEHIYLQTGSKYYAMHLGPKGGMKTPCKEDDPRTGPNFYYALEDQLVETATRHNLTWSVARPPCILGFTVDTAMNLGTSLAIYALVMKELGKPLIFPYGEKAFNCFLELVNSKSVAKFIHWLVDDNNPHNKNQAFNVTNGDLYRMRTLWYKIADYFGMEVEVTHDKSFNMRQFMQDKKEVWGRIVEKNSLKNYDLDSLGTWDFMENMLNRDWDEFMLINKSLKYGWTERLDTLNVLESFFDELGLLKVIPLQTRQPVKKQAAVAIKKEKIKEKKKAGAIQPEVTGKSAVSRG